jgi:hypothetical protein
MWRIYAVIEFYSLKFVMLRFENYSEKIAISQLTVSKPSILNRFRKMNSDKLFNKQIKPFNFILVGPEKNEVIPLQPFLKDIQGIEYREFIDYRTGKSSNELPLPSNEYWKSLDDVLTAYIRHNDNKFDYIDHVAHRKHIIADSIRFIGKESNNLDENLTGIEGPEYLEYKNNKEFFDWIMTLKPKDVKDKRISQQALYYQKSLIKSEKHLNVKQKVARKLLELYKENKAVSKE